jgi:HTH-type transcriptional regulator, transcriptional repressor of NAD biosynthesis genes
MRNAIVLMTALPPTIGHQALIDFAISFVMNCDDGGQVRLLINARKCEPIKGFDRCLAIIEHYKDHIENGYLRVEYCEEDLPQNPTEHIFFWYIWCDIIKKFLEVKEDDFIIASETYGAELAKRLNCEFIPYDIPRATLPKVHATSIRKCYIDLFHQIIPEMRSKLQKRVTIFGQESTGKTTLSEKLAYGLNGYFLPEYARGYLELETIGAEITNRKMKNIFYAQMASQLAVRDDKPFIFQDTDLLSTIGYYLIWKKEYPSEYEILFSMSKSDLYILMNDKIPFEPDILRYGGDKRESSMNFWIKLLKSRNCNYHIMKSTDPGEQLMEAINVVFKLANIDEIKEFVRT